MHVHLDKFGCKRHLRVHGGNRAPRPAQPRGAVHGVVKPTDMGDDHIDTVISHIISPAIDIDIQVTKMTISIYVPCR